MKDVQYYNALARSPILLKKKFQAVIEAEFLDQGVARATLDLAHTLSHTMALADVLGRKKIMDTAGDKTTRFRALNIEYDTLVVSRFGGYSDLPSPTEGAFDDAMDALLKREPVVAKYKGDIQKAYGVGRWFSVSSLPGKLALKAAQNLTVRLWEKVTELGMAGRSPVEAKRILSEMSGFSESYAETVYRTNLAGAYTAGRFKQMQDPDVRAVAPGFEYTAIGDHSTRKNHAAADGMIADTHDKVWDSVSPPMGYNCRCDLRIVDCFELQERGLLTKDGHAKLFLPTRFREAQPDKGFTVTRPDRRMYEG